MAHYRKRTKKSSYTQTLHLKPFAAGFSRKNWKGNLLMESGLCFENRLAELSLSNLGSRSQFSAGGTSGSCPVRDAGITEWQRSRGRWCSDMTCCPWPYSHFSQGSAQPIPAPVWGSEQVFWGPSPGQFLSEALPGKMLRLCPSSGRQSHLTLTGSKGHLPGLPCLWDLERGGDIWKNGAIGKGAQKQLWPEDMIVSSISSLLHVLPK